MHLLVSLLFHELTSLHPPSFQRNDFSTCTFSYEQNPVFRFLGQPLCRQECLFIEARGWVELGVIVWGGIDPSLTAYRPLSTHINYSTSAVSV